jgi:hypothetical protein
MKNIDCEQLGEAIEQVLDTCSVRKLACAHRHVVGPAVH